MPIYEYVCRACGKPFEELVRADERPHCVHCGSQNVERQLSVFAARQGGSLMPSLPVGGCGRCGDPHGPCST